MKTQLNLLLLLLLSFPVFLSGQVQKIPDSLIYSIRSNQPDDKDYGDLEIIGQSIGEADIVLLGEQDHGDAATFEAKTRLVQYLHEKKGFDVVVFESDFYGMYKTNELYPQAIDSTIRNILPVWRKCEGCQALFQYIKQKNIAIDGIDNQHFSYYSYYHALKDFTQLTNNLRPHYHWSDSARFASILEKLYHGEMPSLPSLEDQQFFYSTMNTMSETIEHTKMAEKIFWLHEIKNISKVAQQVWGGRKDLRDVQMAENFNWLFQQKYHGKNVIVWAANYHIAKSIEVLSPKDNLQTVGSILKGLYKSRVYSLGFTSYAGRAGRIHLPQFDVKRPSKKSIEARIKQLNYPFAFVPLKSLSLTYKMKAFAHLYEEKTDWSQVFDGIFYLEKMAPCSTTNSSPQ